MRILILTNNDIGLYKFRKELLEEFRNNNYDVFVSLPDGEFVGNIEALNCQFIETDINRRGTNPIQDIKLYQKYKQIIEDVKPDIVLTYTIKPNVYGGLACQKYHIPYLANITGLGSALENPGPLQLLTKFLYRLGLNKAKTVFFQNKDNQDFMINNDIVKGEYELLPGSGVNLKQYSYSEYPKDGIINFVFVGRMMKEKGFGLYLDAAETIHQKYPRTVFHICGIKEENYSDRVQKLVDKKTCIYHGNVDDMKNIYDNMHCIIHPTYYPEGMSNVLLEASACGRPSITTDRSGCKEIIKDGYNGYIVRQNDLDSLIEKIEKFINLSYEDKKQLGINAREMVEKHFDRKIVVDKYMEKIKEYE